MPYGHLTPTDSSVFEHAKTAADFDGNIGIIPKIHLHMGDK